MSGLFDDDPTPPRRTAPPARPQRSRALVVTAVVLIVAFFLLSAFTGLWTDRLWFNSVGFGGVFTTVLTTRVLLFIVFGLIMGGFVAANVVLAFRYRPPFRSLPSEASLERYREAVEPLRAWVVVVVGGLLALIAGGSAAGQWRTYLMWREGTDFGTQDAWFNRDIGFFVFDLPWLHYVVNFAMMMVVLGLIAAIVVHYLFGGISLQSRSQKVSGAAQVQFSVLLGLFVLFKAADYYLDRFDLSTEQGRRFTGVNYTAFNAILPSKNILMFIALICALLFFANIFRRTWLLPASALGLLVLSAVLLGAVWPGLVWQFQVKPSEPDKEEQFLAANIDATRAAYNIEDSSVQQYDATVNVTKEQLRESAETLPGIRLIDPARTSQAFEQLQQVRGYYSMPPVLDVDNYEINGETRDLVMGVRELDQSGLVAEQRNWANEHTVYTHGFGLVAAFGNNRTSDGGTPSNPDEPPWAEEDLPPRGELSDLTDEGYEPRIYFGERAPEYSIVGKASEDAPDVELDIPDAASEEQSNYTYDGADGVPVGGIVNKVLYALKFGEPNFVLSSRVNENSKVLYERHPRERVQKVAPWLTVDSDPYPAVVDGRVLWIMDGYTTTDRYPNAERESFEEMTSDALTTTTSYVTLPTDQVNYIRNSVKATVDAYSGEVTLYEWEEDPILEAWKKVFNGTVQERDDISDELMEHLRYPEDMFKTQRYMLAQYHVTTPQEFYRGTDRWQVPEDPAETVKNMPPYRLSVQLPAEVDQSEEIGQAVSEDVEAPEPEDTSDLPTGDPVFSLTSVFTPTNRQNLASFVSVNSDATNEDYGKIRILRLPDSTQVQGPSQIANTFSADESIQSALLPIKQNSQILDGNLLTLPVGGGLLYVQPVYALRQSGEGSYPVLQFVLASFGQTSGFGTTLTEALNDVLESGTLTEEDTGGTEEVSGGQGNDDSEQGGDGGGDVITGGLPPQVADLLQQAVDTFGEADQALRDGDTVRYAELTEEAEQLVRDAQAAAAVAEEQADGGGDGGGGDGQSGQGGE